MDKFEILLQLLCETPEVIARFKKFWYEYSSYRERTIEDSSPENVLEECMSLVFSQFDILEERIHNIIRIAEQVKRKSEGDR